MRYAPALPFLKWAGGKRGIMGQMLPLLPKRWNKYHEPFLGGGALYFALRPPGAALSDTNKRLINTWCWVRDSPQEVVALLYKHSSLDSEGYYKEVRVAFNLERNNLSVEQAARFLYLNRAGHGGLYRENRKGAFNVPYAHKRSGEIVLEDRIVAASQALQGIDIECRDFRSIPNLNRISAGDFIYFDPPYAPIDKSSFSSYAAPGFGEADHMELAGIAKVLAERGVKVAISNSDTPFTRSLYEGGQLHEIKAPRMCDSKGGRQPAAEILVVYDYG